jgi:hypothetical protein
MTPGAGGKGVFGTALGVIPGGIIELNDPEQFTEVDEPILGIVIAVV